MLVLTRRLSEVIRIGNDIRVTVVEIRQDRVRLGIEAPKDVPIFRDELKKVPYAEDNIKRTAETAGRDEQGDVGDILDPTEEWGHG